MDFVTRIGLVAFGVAQFLASHTLCAQELLVTRIDEVSSAGAATFDPLRQRAVMARQTQFASWALHSDLLLWNGADWVPVLPAIDIADRVEDLLWDPLRARLVVLGNRNLMFVTGSTVISMGWLPGVFLTAHEHRRFALDTARDELVMFGGSYQQAVWGGTVTIYIDTTWVYRSGSWVQMNVASPPPPRTGHTMVYDPVRQRTVLVGGGNAGGVLSDTWEWDGTTWSQRLVAGPTAARGLFDAATQRVVVADQAGAVWSFDGSAWTPVGTGASGREPTLFTDGSALLLTSYSQPSITPQPQTLETLRLAGAVWSPVATASHPKFYGSETVRMTYDAVRRELVAVVSYGLGDTRTWIWNGSWQLRATVLPGGSGGLTFDAGRGEVVWFGGAAQNETWTWDGTTWTQRPTAHAPSARLWPNMTYDEVRQRVVLFSGEGVNFPTLVGETWLFDGVDWAPDLGPQLPTMWADVFAFDPSRGAVVASVGVGSAGSTETWEWNGQWTQASATSGAGVGWLVAFDPNRGRLQSYERGGPIREWTGSTWVARANAIDPELTPRGAATDTDRGRILFLAGQNSPLDYWDETKALHVLGPTPSAVVDLGGGCASGIALEIEGRPAIGLGIEVTSRLAASSLAIFGLGFQTAPVSVGNCTVLVSPLAAVWRFAGVSGRVDLPLTIAPTNSLRGLQLVVQAVTVQQNALVFSHALQLSVGD
ncbi:MAG TPA: kelch repeat-containing protein [Planctomycetota bacterium]|nr:kelch repeat-containing protein [Planctomycetota bacterium]